MSQTRMTRVELEEENAALRGRLAEARDLIDEALDMESEEPSEEEEDEESDAFLGGINGAR